MSPQRAGEDTTVDVIVIGAGAMGSAAAWHLARRGADVLLLEQFDQGHVNGSSHGGSRIFRLAYADPAFVRLALESADLWREVEDDWGHPLLELTGGVDHGDGADVLAVADALEAAGRTVERLDASAAEERWPGMRFDELVVFSPDTGRVLADEAVRALQTRAAFHGGSVEFGTRVVGIDATTHAVRLEGGRTVTARRAIVVTAGAWVAKLVERAAGAHISLPPITVTREQAFHFEPTAADDTDWPSFIHYRTPSHYGLVTPGEGVKVAEHGTGPAVDPDTRTFTIDEIGRRRVMQYVEKWLPGLQTPPVSETTCLYTNTPDASFVLERSGALVVGSACSGHGFKFTPAIGKRLADLALHD